MTPRRTLVAALALAVALPAALGVLNGCQENPPEPVFDNPFDPAGPAGGDPLNIRALYVGGLVNITWTHPEGYGIATYDVDRSIGDQASWETLAFDLPPENPGYVDSTAAPNSLLFYKVQAKQADGSFTVSSYITAAELETPPLARPDPPGQSRASRWLNLKIVTGQGDEVLVADNPDFADAEVHPAPAAGDTLPVTWDLGQHAQDDTVRVYVRSVGPGYVSVTNEAAYVVDFAPAFTVQDAGDGGTVATRDIVLEVPLTGVERMRFASTQAGLDGAAVIDPPTATHPYQLADLAVPQAVWGRFDGDFGFASDVELIVTPDLLTDVTMSLVVGANGVTSFPWVRIASDAVATFMRFTDSGDFTGVPWIAYADTFIYDFTPVAGRRVISAEYRNDWVTPGTVYRDTLEYVLVPLTIAFHTPRPDERVAGGTSYLVSGRAVAADGAVLANVELDLGDGAGFAVFPGTSEYWSYSWQVPTFTEDTTVVLRARATAGGETAVAAVSVVVTQLGIAITEPAPDAVLAPDASVTIAGTASPGLGAPLDSVTVDIGAEHFLAEGTDDWTVDWTTPDVAGPTPLTITATAWADGATAQTAIDVSVEPAAR